ncbi:MAG: ABC transporter permease [Chloroflexota bacterium]|nr:ABC transporter permease [Chloroflexota bacterium]
MMTGVGLESEQQESVRTDIPLRTKRVPGLASFSPGLLSFLSVVIGLLLWQGIAAYVHNGLFLASPTQVARAIALLWMQGELQFHMLVSGEEFLVGFLIGAFAGIIVGLLMASFRTVNSLLSPWVSGIYATPIIALSPLLILWLGIGIWSKIAVVISVVVFPVIINTETGIRETEAHLLEAIRSFGASRSQLFRKVSLPSALPFILAGLRLGVGRGLIGVVVGELFGARAGLGFLITNAANVFDMPDLFAGVIVLAAAGIVLTAAVRVMEHRLVPWKQV